MIKKLLLVCCTAFLLSNCSGFLAEDDSERRQGRSNGDGDDIESDLRDPNQVKNVCKGEGYTIYSHSGCPETSSMDDISQTKNKQKKRAVDILFVIDTTLSMYFYLDRGFKKRFKNFIPIINGDLDWRIMFTNSAYSDGWFSFLSTAMNGEAMKLEDKHGITNLRYLDHTVPDYSQVFIYTISKEPERETREDHLHHRGECQYPPYCHTLSSEPLQVLKSSFMTNKHFTRKEADFVVVILSNNDDDLSSATTSEDVINEFKKVYGSEKKLLALNLIILPGDRECEKKNDDRLWLSSVGMGTNIADLATKTGGGNFSLCLDDFSIVAEALVNCCPASTQFKESNK